MVQRNSLKCHFPIISGSTHQSFQGLLSQHVETSSRSIVLIAYRWSKDLHISSVLLNLSHGVAVGGVNVLEYEPNHSITGYQCTVLKIPVDFLQTLRLLSSS